MGVALIVLAVSVLAIAVYLATRERGQRRHKHEAHADSVMHCRHCGEHISVYETRCPYCDGAL